MKIDHQAYSIREGLILQVILSLNLRASYDIGVNVHGVDLNASELSTYVNNYTQCCGCVKFKVLVLIFTAIRI